MHWRAKALGRSTKQIAGRQSGRILFAFLFISGIAGWLRWRLAINRRAALFSSPSCALAASPESGLLLAVR